MVLFVVKIMVLFLLILAGSVETQWGLYKMLLLRGTLQIESSAELTFCWFVMSQGLSAFLTENLHWREQCSSILGTPKDTVPSSTNKWQLSFKPTTFKYENLSKFCICLF